MKKYKIVPFEHSVDRFCVVTSKGNLFLDANGSGYRSEKAAKAALCNKISDLVKFSKNKTFLKMTYETSGPYRELFNVLNSLWEAHKEDDFVSSVEVAQAVESCPAGICGLTKKEFIERYITYRKYKKLF